MINNQTYYYYLDFWNEKNKCPVCLKSLKKNSKKKVIGHENGGQLHPIHENCMKAWNNNICMLCNKEVNPHKILHTWKARRAKYITDTTKTGLVATLIPLVCGLACSLLLTSTLDSHSFFKENRIAMLGGSAAFVASYIGGNYGWNQRKWITASPEEEDKLSNGCKVIGSIVQTCGLGIVWYYNLEYLKNLPTPLQNISVTGTVALSSGLTSIIPIIVPIISQEANNIKKQLRQLSDFIARPFQHPTLEDLSRIVNEI